MRMDGLKAVGIAGVVIVSGIIGLAAFSGGEPAPAPAAAAAFTADEQATIDRACHTFDTVGDTDVLYPVRYPDEYVHCLGVMARDVRRDAK